MTTAESKNEDRSTIAQDNTVKTLEVTPWKIVEHFRDSKGRDAERDLLRRQDWANALVNARPENPAQWRGREFVVELPTTVFYPSGLFGEIGVTCVAPGRYRLVVPRPVTEPQAGETVGG